MAVARGDGTSPAVRPALLARTSDPRVKWCQGGCHRVRGIQAPLNAAAEPCGLVGLDLSHKVNFVVVAQGSQIHSLVVRGMGLLQEHADTHLVGGPPAFIVLPLPDNALSRSGVPGEEVPVDSSHCPCMGRGGKSTVIL